jgi:hypothetical protein
MIEIHEEIIMHRYITTIIASLMPFQLSDSVIAKAAQPEATINRADRPSAEEVLASEQRR